ncbi:rhodanese-related sulfurtransferase [Pseudonocardia sediminis]|uniref:Rhodanese-related sulfurtransferase n=1 Tax=Pseudonocardia sediminis TaxID=1397368 RepID=A0A4Q7U7D7_PSEST|nr:rhodanese-like domain-containing protein [Pseudonocardia sediminis]RZT75444.1 rhodanese-related sulfurtransferase [Pseudonocardia sediminis]
MTTPEIPQVNPAEAAELARSGALLLDVREPDEWRAGHIDGAVHVPLGDLDPGAVGTGRPVIAICRSGNRSGKAAVVLAGAGIDVRNLAGGMKAWDAAGLPFLDDSGRPGAVG